MDDGSVWRKPWDGAPQALICLESENSEQIKAHLTAIREQALKEIEQPEANTVPAHARAKACDEVLAVLRLLRSA